MLSVRTSLDDQQISFILNMIWMCEQLGMIEETERTVAEDTKIQFRDLKGELYRAQQRERNRSY